MAFKATKVQVVPKGSKDTNYTSLATFKDVSKYEDAREALRPWAVYVVRYLQGEPGQMGRVRAIDRDLKLQKPQVKDVMAEFLPRNRLPLALYEIFPEFFDVESDERLKKTDTRGEGHAITLLATAPDITGEPVADWDPETERLGDAPARVEAEPEGANLPPYPRRYEGESTRNLSLIHI